MLLVSNHVGFLIEKFLLLKHSVVVFFTGNRMYILTTLVLAEAGPVSSCADDSGTTRVRKHVFSGS